MSKFFIMSALRSEVISGGREISNCISKTILVFVADDLKNTSINGCGLIFRCRDFSLDEEASSGDWKNAFDITECDDMIIIMIKFDYSSPSVIFPFVWNIGADYYRHHFYFIIKTLDFFVYFNYIYGIDV